MEKVSTTKLKAAMIAAQIGVNALAKAAGLQPVTITRILKGDSEQVRFPTVGKLSRALNCSPDEILKED